jgi:hypothetical protein
LLFLFVIPAGNLLLPLPLLVHQDGWPTSEIWVPHLRDGFIVAKVGIVRSATVFSSYRPYAQSAEVAEMYDPPSDCKGKVQREKVCVNVSGLWVEIGSPGLDEIRRVPVLRNPSAV